LVGFISVVGTSVTFAPTSATAPRVYNYEIKQSLAGCADQFTTLQVEVIGLTAEEGAEVELTKSIIPDVKFDVEDDSISFSF